LLKMTEPSDSSEMSFWLINTQESKKHPYALSKPSIGETYVVTLKDDVCTVESVTRRQGKSVSTPVEKGQIPARHSLNFDLPHHQHSKTIHDNGEFHLTRNSSGKLSGIRVKEGAVRQCSHLSSTAPEPEDEETEEGGSKSGETQEGS